MLASLSPARRRLVVGLLGVLVAATVAVGALVARASMGMPRGPVRQDLAVPVLLVPGYGGGTGGLTSLGAVLRAAGKDVTLVRLPGNATGDLAEQAEALDEQVEDVLRRTGAASVDVVGHSAGGVVARLWATDQDSVTVPRRVVTLGSPHHGTQLALLAGLVGRQCADACRQLASDSELLRALDTVPLPQGAPFVSLWTTDDQTVVPPDSARVEGAVNVEVQRVCAAAQVTHGGLLTEPFVQRMVLEALSTAAVPTWTASDCARLSS